MPPPPLQRLFLPRCPQNALGGGKSTIQLCITDDGASFSPSVVLVILLTKAHGCKESAVQPCIAGGDAFFSSSSSIIAYCLQRRMAAESRLLSHASPDPLSLSLLVVLPHYLQKHVAIESRLFRCSSLSSAPPRISRVFLPHYFVEAHGCEESAVQPCIAAAGVCSSHSYAR